MVGASTDQVAICGSPLSHDQINTYLFFFLYVLHAYVIHSFMDQLGRGTMRWGGMERAGEEVWTWQRGGSRSIRGCPTGRPSRIHHEPWKFLHVQSSLVDQYVEGHTIFLCFSVYHERIQSLCWNPCHIARDTGSGVFSVGGPPEGGLLMVDECRTSVPTPIFSLFVLHIRFP